MRKYKYELLGLLFVFMISFTSGAFGTHVLYRYTAPFKLIASTTFTDPHDGTFQVEIWRYHSACVAAIVPTAGPYVDAGPAVQQVPPDVCDHAQEILEKL